ncbi:MAG: hypothetical protein GXX04_04835 [Clostridiaceae bacterium]|nr:hypothetical protein [Clostridiaceae bacterium]
MKRKAKWHLILCALFISLLSCFVFEKKVVESFFTGFGWPFRFLYFMSHTIPANAFDALGNITVIPFNFRIELYLLNALIYYGVVLLLYKLIGNASDLIKKHNLRNTN